jgi:hypothetical protein
MEAVLSTYTESWEGLEQRRADGTQYWEAEPCVPLVPPLCCLCPAASIAAAWHC